MYPILFEIGSIYVSSIWIMVCLGFLVSGMVLIQLAQYKGMKIAFLVHSFFPMLFWGLVGGRIFFIITTYQDIFAEPIKYAPIRMIGIWDRGLEFWGVVTAMLIYLSYACKKNEESRWRWADILSLSILAGIPFGHLGAYLEGLNFGRETNLPWGVTFESFTVPYTVPIHPTQIYALVYSLVIAIVAAYIFLKKPLRHDGDVALGASASYGILRFIEEFFRGDEALTLFGMSMAYLLSLGVAIIAGILLLNRYNKLDFIHKKRP